MIETMACKSSKYKLQGTTETLYGDDHYLDLLERVKMKYATPFITLDPVLELALVIGQTAILTHHQNNFQVPATVDLNENVEDFTME